MKLRWFGQSCFYLTSHAGTRLLMDPSARWLGYRMPQVEADVVTTSHDHFDHNFLGMVDGNFYHIDRPGEYTVKDVAITGTHAWHDAVGGARHGRDIIYTFHVDGLSVCHLGDLGHLLSPEQVRSIGKVDVLLLPVGGAFAITVPQALEVRAQINPVVTVPMHYRTRALGLAGLIFAPLRKFLSLVGEPVRQERELSVDVDTLPQYAGTVVLKYE